MKFCCAHGYSKFVGKLHEIAPSFTFDLCCKFNVRAFTIPLFLFCVIGFPHVVSRIRLCSTMFSKQRVVIITQITEPCNCYPMSSSRFPVLTMSSQLITAFICSAEVLDSVLDIIHFVGTYDTYQEGKIIAVVKLIKCIRINKGAYDNIIGVLKIILYLPKWLDVDKIMFTGLTMIQKSLFILVLRHHLSFIVMDFPNRGIFVRNVTTTYRD